MSQNEATIELTETLLAELSGITDETLRAQFLEQNQLYSPVVIKRLNDAARTKLRVDPRQSIALADAAVAIAESLRSEELLGPSLRAKANALYVLGDNQSSLQCHDQALAIFRRQANLEEEARTLNASIQPYILLGRYDRALEAATAAGISSNAWAIRAGSLMSKSTLAICITARTVLRKLLPATTAPTRFFCRSPIPRAWASPFTTCPFASSA